MNFVCPTCSITLQAEAELAGKTVKCPGCSSRIQIPEDFGHTHAPEAASESHAPETTGEDSHDHLPELDVSSTPPGSHPSSVNLWIAGAIGLGATVFWFLLMFLFPAAEDGETSVGVAGYLRELFTERGWPQYVTTLLMFWCLGLLVLKWLNIRKQRRAMLIQALPTDIDEEINPSNLAKFHEHIVNFPKPLRNTYIVNRIRKALEFFYVRQNNPEVAQMNSAQSEVDAAKVNSSYAMVKVFLWAIPIMGFIGTVLGIGNAIGGFGAVFGAGEGGDMSQIKEPLLAVLGSMGVAFDTTLLALVFSILLSFPASGLQNQEDDLVTDVDEYCIDHLLKRLDDGGSGSGYATETGAIGEVMQRLESIQKRMSDTLSEQTKHHEKVAETVDRQLQAIQERADKYEQRLDDDFFSTLERLRTESIGVIEGQVAPLSEGINNLNSVLKDLNGKQVVVKKKGWFGRG